MMTAYLVHVRTPKEERYIDNCWISEASARKRVCQLHEAFKRSGYKVSSDPGYFWAWLNAIEIEDGAIAPKTK